MRDPIDGRQQFVVVARVLRRFAKMQDDFRLDPRLRQGSNRETSRWFAQEGDRRIVNMTPHRSGHAVFAPDQSVRETDLPADWRLSTRAAAAQNLRADAVRHAVVECAVATSERFNDRSSIE